jgi:hypothetical protein
MKIIIINLASHILSIFSIKSMIKNNILSYIFWIFLVIIWIAHSQLLWLFWLEEYVVKWNYEFTKVILFNLIIPLLFVIVFWYSLFSGIKIKYNKKILIFLIISYIFLWLSTYFSYIPNNSIFWWVDKGHWFIFFNNLILLYFIVYRVLSINKPKHILYSAIFTTLIITLIWIKEYFIPSYNYWDLWNRLVSTLWHPNYVSALYIIIFPYLCNIFKNNYWYKKYIIWSIWLVFLLWLLLTKSYIAIFIIFGYFLYEILWNHNRKYFLFILSIILIIWLLSVFNYFPEKLNSLISRFYIWETTLKIIFSDIKIFFFWIWWENLKLLFDNYKSTELYLYENIWFNADRPHNIFLNSWVHYWFFIFIISLIVFVKVLFSFIKNKYRWYTTSLLLIILFWCFNFPNVIWYIFLIILLWYFSIKNLQSSKESKIIHLLFISVLFLVSIFWSYYSVKSYLSQSYIKQDNYSQAINIFPYYWEYHYNSLDFTSWLNADNKIKTEKYYLYKIYFSFEKIPECDTLVLYYPSIENYLYCWNIVESKFGLEKALKYYKVAIDKMPDIWNTNSKYLQNKYLRQIINPERILHPKFSNLQEVINKIQ